MFDIDANRPRYHHFKHLIEKKLYHNKNKNMFGLGTDFFYIVRFEG